MLQSLRGSLHLTHSPFSPPAGTCFRTISTDEVEKKLWSRKDHIIDEAAERRRLKLRVVFDAQQWRFHRSSRRFLESVTLPMSSVVLQTIQPIIMIAAFTIAVCCGHVVTGGLVSLPPSLLALSGPTLGLLLVFNTNASYERWDSARKMVGLVKNRSEDLTRQATCWFPSDKPEEKAQMIRYVQSFFFALKVHLRGGSGGLESDEQLRVDLRPILRPRELRDVMCATNRPAYILQCLTSIVNKADLDAARQYRMDHNLTALSDVLGGCERILSTPIPLNYTRMTTRFLLLWLMLAPFALAWQVAKVQSAIWITPLCVMFLAFLLLGVDEVAIQIEEPFSILPLEAYAAGSQKNIADLIIQADDVQKAIHALVPPVCSPPP